MSADKGGKPFRDVPIHESLYPELKKWHKEDNKTGPIVHYLSKPIKSIKKAWTATLKRAGITRRIRPYDLRHHFVTSLLESGTDIKTVSEIVGSKPATLMKYYQHVTSEQHRKAIAKIPALELENP